MIRETFTFFLPEERPKACRSDIGGLDISVGWGSCVCGVALASWAMPMSAESLQSGTWKLSISFLVTLCCRRVTLSSLGQWCLESCLPCTSDHSRAGHQLFPCWAVSLYLPLTLALGSRHHHPLIPREETEAQYH